MTTTGMDLSTALGDEKVVACIETMWAEITFVTDKGRLVFIRHRGHQASSPGLEVAISGVRYTLDGYDAFLVMPTLRDGPMVKS